MSYVKRRHVIFVTAKGLDYCRVSEGDHDFPRGRLYPDVYKRYPVTDSEIESWATIEARGIGPGATFRIEVW